MKRTSLRTRLIVVSTAFVTLIWLSAIVIVAFNLKWFLDRIIDIELERDMQLANHLYALISESIDSPSLDAIENLYKDVGMISALQGEWGFRVFYEDGRSLLASVHVPDFPRPQQEGFSNLEVDGELWRLYARTLEENIWTVLVANKSGANSLILQNLSPTPWFLLLILPVTIFAAVYGIHRATQPIKAMESTVRQRSPRSLDPLDAGSVPVEIEPLVGAVNQLLERVRNLVRHEQRFVANAAHELQTPLAAMKTELQNCIAQTEDEELAFTLARLEKRLNRSVYSVKQLLTLARLDPDAPLQRIDTANLEHIVYDELAAQGDNLLRLNLETEVRCNAPPLTHCNNDLVTIAVRNLVENAIKYATKGTRIEIDTQRQRNGISLRVANDCAPMTLETMQQLRDSFFRVTGNDATGVGLGLAIVDRIATLHSGSLDFQYRKGEEGLAVTVQFSDASEPKTRS